MATPRNAVAGGPGSSGTGALRDAATTSALPPRLPIHSLRFLGRRIYIITVADDDAAYRLGQATLAPVFAAFAELLLAESRQRGFDRLAFLARDGHFLMTVTERIAASSPAPPQLIYAHLTRRSTALAASGHLQTREIAKAAGVWAGVTTWGSALAYYGIEGEEAADLLASSDTSLSAPLPSAAHITRVVARDSWTGSNRWPGSAAQLLLSYLHQTGLANCSGTALVDIGWRATIQHHLTRVATGFDGVQCPAGT